MRSHWNHNQRNIHLEFLLRARFNVVKMVTPPKSKSPWEAMTAGSTGGWAKGLQPLGPVLTAASGAIPVVGPLVSTALGAAGAMGGGTGFQGTDKGWSNLGSTALGAVGGYGVGGIGAGIGSGLKNFMTSTDSFGSGFGAGVKNYVGTSLIPGIQATSGTSIAKGVGGVLNTVGQGVSNLASNLVGGGTSTGVSGAGTTSGFNLGNIANLILGGAQALTGAPSTSPSAAREAIYSPNLVEARSMIRDLALMNPSEILSPASDEFIQASLRQSRESADYQKRYLINEYSKRGKVVGKSGGLDAQLAKMAKEQTQKEQDWITSVNEARYIAAVGQKINAVKDYYKISEQEAADILAAEGYIKPEEAANYLSMLSQLQSAQTLF